MFGKAEIEIQGARMLSTVLCGPLIKQESGQAEFSTWPVAKGAFNIRHKVDEAAGSTPPTAAVDKEAVDRVVEAVR